MLKTLFYLCLISIFCASCIKEFSPQSGSEDPKLVVKAEIESGAVAPLIELRASFRNSDSLLELSNELNVELYEEANPVPYDLNLVQESGTHWQVPEELVFEEGKSYFLKVDPSSLGIQAAHAEAVIPFPGSMSTEDAIYMDADNSFNTSLYLNAPPKITSYYHLIPFVLDEEGHRVYLEIDQVINGTNAAIVLNNRYGMLIDYFSLPEDKYLSFNTESLLSGSIENLNPGFLYLILRTVDEDYYLYNKSLSKLAESNQNPFTLPTTTFTNISNGYGLFSAYSSVIDSIHFE
jgi:hypothetical protein